MSGSDNECEIQVIAEKKATSTYDWVASLPLASSAGGTVCSFYESSKNCCRLSAYALGTVESSVKYAAGAAAPVVKRLDGPIATVDGFTLRQLERLEEKVPAIKKQPNEVLEMLTDSRQAVYNHLSDGKQAVTTRLATGRDAITTRLTDGKDAIATRLYDGKDAIVSGVKAGSDVIANTRAGTLVGRGVDSTICATEAVVDYLLPPEENEKELLSEEVKEESEKDVTLVPLDQAPEEKEDSSDSESEDEEKEEGEEGACEEAGVGRVTRVCLLSRKVKLRMYRRSLRRLHSVQQQCKGTLDQLKVYVQALKLARAAREGIEKQYASVHGAVKDMEAQLRSLMKGQPTEESVAWAKATEAEDEEEEEDIQWLTPKEERTRVQASFDYAKQLSEQVYCRLQTVAKATSLLPHHLKDGATQVYGYAQELYTTLKAAKVPSDLPSSTLNRLSDVIETQLGYVKQLGTFITSTLKPRRTTPEEVEVTISVAGGNKGSSSEEEESDEEEEDPANPASAERPPGDSASSSSSSEESEGEQ